jgi:hypothetical protein
MVAYPTPSAEDYCSVKRYSREFPLRLVSPQTPSDGEDRCSESSFDRYLERSRASLVVESAGVPEALIEHLGSLAKKQVREGRIYIPEVGMIEYVERLYLQLHIQSFVKLVRLSDTKIPLHFRETAEKIARRVSRHRRIR